MKKGASGVSVLDMDADAPQAGYFRSNIIKRSQSYTQGRATIKTIVWTLAEENQTGYRIRHFDKP